MTLQEELNDIFNMIQNHSDEIENINFYVRMKNGTVFKYKMDKQKEFRLKLKDKEEARKRREKEEERERKKNQ